MPDSEEAVMVKHPSKISFYFPLVLFALLLASIEDGRADAKAPSGGDAMLKKAQGMIRQLSQEKTALEAEKTAWLNDKSALDAKVQALTAAVEKLLPLQAEVERYKSGLEAVRANLEAQLGQERQSRQALLAKHNDVVAKARDIQSDNQLLVQAVQEREQWIADCTTRNRAMQTANQEILAKYQEKGVWQQLAELEPVTGIARVETESVVEGYQYKLQQLKITPFQPAAGTDTSSAAAEPEAGATPEPAAAQSAEGGQP